VTAPERHGEKERLARTVVLHTARGDQHICVAAPDAGVAPGDIGIATIRGLDLVSFDVHRHIQVPRLPGG
jgi:hypothetical protein